MGDDDWVLRQLEQECRWLPYGVQFDNGISFGLSARLLPCSVILVTTIFQAIKFKRCTNLDRKPRKL